VLLLLFTTVQKGGDGESGIKPKINVVEVICRNAGNGYFMTNKFLHGESYAVAISEFVKLAFIGTSTPDKTKVK
jgi:hypothetical protein